MRTIKLKSLSLINFKGVRSLNVMFHDEETLLCGDNGTGKQQCLIRSFGCSLVKTAQDVQIAISILRRWMQTESQFCTLNTLLRVCFR